MEAFVAQDRLLGMDIAAAPLARCAVLRREGGEGEGEIKVLVLTIHHAIVDGWSMQIILNLLGEAYAIRRRHSAVNKSDQLEVLEPHPSFASFVKWERSDLDPDTAVPYFKSLLAGCSASTPFSSWRRPSGFAL